MFRIDVWRAYISRPFRHCDRTTAGRHRIVDCVLTSFLYASRIDKTQDCVSITYGPKMQTRTKGPRPTLVVVGHGMVGQRLLASLAEAGLTRKFEIVIFGEEPRLAYDRVALSSLFDGRSAADLSLVPPGFFESSGIRARTGESVTDIDRANKTLTSSSGATLAYDKLVLATGSRPFVPPLPGRDLVGCFPYRTVEDVARIRAYAEGARVGAVIGGGLLGLEAAKALKSLRLDT